MHTPTPRLKSRIWTLTAVSTYITLTHGLPRPPQSCLLSRYVCSCRITKSLVCLANEHPYGPIFTFLPIRELTVFPFRVEFTLEMYVP